MRELPSPETMLTYASILEKPQYVVKNGVKFPIATGEIVEAACAALREMAALQTLAADWRVSAELIGIRVKNGCAAPVSSITNPEA